MTLSSLLCYFSRCAVVRWVNEVTWLLASRKHSTTAARVTFDLWPWPAGIVVKMCSGC